ncbi:MAG: PAS domain S-box protein [Candidatus Latescibacterota bacterium]
MPLGKTLKALRQKQNLNQKALSALSGVSQATISRIETGRVRQLRSSALKNLADALGVSVDFLMGDHEVFASIPGPGSGGGSAIPGMREDRFRQIADTLDGFAVHEQGRILYVNQTLAEMLGYRKEELLGKNGIEMVTAPQSRSTVQRMVATVATERYEALFVRKDGSIFPVEIAGRNISENVRLAVVHDITARRCQQAVARLQQAGLEAERLDDMVRVVRVMSDELEDMGLPFEAVGTTVISEEADRLAFHVALPESRGYRTLTEELPLQEAMQRHPSVRGLVSHWRRSKVWEREGEDEYLRLLTGTSVAPGEQTIVLVDVPFAQGTAFIALTAGRGVRVEDAVNLLRAMSQACSCILKRLQEIDSLTAQVRELRGQLQHADA